MNNTIIIDNPEVQKALSFIRDRDLSYAEFRKHADVVCETLIKKASASFDKEKEIVLVPILRAGIAMLASALKTMPTARVGFVGLERDEQTAIAKEYYWKLPVITDESTVVLLDPMLATGGSIHHVLKKLDVEKVNEIRVVSVISALEGIAKVQSDFPGVKIITAAVDEGLDAKKFIVPGLGDFGDRYFGTE